MQQFEGADNIMKKCIVIVLVICLLPAVTLGSNSGKLALVSIGPGDPKYLTLQAISYIRAADLILGRQEEFQNVREYLLDKKVETPEEWTKIWTYKGKRWVGEWETFNPEEQQSIIKQKNREMDEYVGKLKGLLAQGKNIVVLDYGDPTVFSKFFFWLLESLPDDQVEVVPGVGAIGASFAALKKACTGANARFVLQSAPREFFGQENSDDLAKDLSKYDGTLVFYMALEEMNKIVATLKKFNTGNLPIAVVYYAGYQGKEKIIKGTLDNILDLTAPEKEKWMGLVIVGRSLTGPSFLLPVENGSKGVAK
jgi:uroporphyrin-III C-methyltransferase